MKKKASLAVRTATGGFYGERMNRRPLSLLTFCRVPSPIALPRLLRSDGMCSGFRVPDPSVRRIRQDVRRRIGCRVSCFGDSVQNVSIFFFLGSAVPCDGALSDRWILVWRAIAITTLFRAIHIQIYLSHS